MTEGFEAKDNYYLKLEEGGKTFTTSDSLMSLTIILRRTVEKSKIYYQVVLLSYVVIIHKVSSDKKGVSERFLESIHQIPMLC